MSFANFSSVDGVVEGEGNKKVDVTKKVDITKPFCAIYFAK